MAAALLHESPFPQITPHDPDDFFTLDEEDRLVVVLDHVRSAAERA